MDLSSPLQSRIRSSRQPSSVPAYKTVPDYDDVARATAGKVTYLEMFITALTDSGLPGPITIMTMEEYLGQGAQFWVQRARMAYFEEGRHYHEAVALKVPKFDSDPLTPLQLGGNETERQLRDVWLEVKALSTPKLQNHPNIVGIFGWAWNDLSFHQPISLVMELATSDLETFFSHCTEQPSPRQLTLLCADIAAALDVIHECEIIHGDLKPANVLLFQRDRLWAKLADFGLSVGTLSTETGTGGTKLGGTEGWRAPEVVAGYPLSGEQLYSADNYSFGLLVWSIVFGQGTTPPMCAPKERYGWIESAFRSASPDIIQHICPSTQISICRLLDENARNRPALLHLLFPATLDENMARLETSVHGDDSIEVNSLVSTNEGQIDFTTQGPEGPWNILSWEHSYMSPFFVQSLLLRTLSSPATLSRSHLLSMLLSLTIANGHQREGDGDLVGTLFNVASEGSTVARASLSDFIDFYGIQAPAEICRHLKDWLEYAIEHGSILARHALQEVDPSALATSLQIFRSEGGYSELYWTMEGGVSTIHEIVCHGTLSDLRSFLATTGNDVIHETTDSDETPLYLACARGAWDIADELLERGACAAGFCTDFGISCLHWVFAFDGDVVHVAIKKLIQAGADVNQLAYYEVPFMHFPFVLPAGTALHWAVVTSSSSAISALIDQGADWSIRDGSDPYKYDRRIRGVTSLRNDSEAYFEPFGETAGLSPLDYSAMHYDSYLFDLLVLKDNVDINSADEEGLTALHRLTDLQVWRTRTQVAYSALPFKGGRPQIRQKIRRCIQAMIALGADLEKPTCLQKSPVGPPDRTPLVLAVLAGLPDVVTALLNAGACINRLDSSGVTALHYNSDNLGINAGIARILLSRGANINNTSGILGPLEHARGDLDQIELLLSYGADIEERYVSGRPPKVGVLGLLAIQPIPPSETRDVRLASIMEKYLFNESGRVKRHSILEHDPRGETLLYRFAEQGHLRCVEVLLRNGAAVSPPAKTCCWRYYAEIKKDESVEYKQPHSAVQARKKMLKEQMESAFGRRFSVQGYKSLCDRADQILSFLEEAVAKRNRTELDEVCRLEDGKDVM